MFEKRFEAGDQNAFAQLSGDYNPLHVDEIAARRYLFGGTVVHGIHMTLWALDSWTAFVRKPVKLSSLKVVFKKNLRVGTTAVCRPIKQEDGAVDLEISDGDQVCALIKAKFQPRSLGVSEIHDGHPPRTEPKIMTASHMAGAAGTFDLHLDRAAASKTFPALTASWPPVQVADLLASTRLVGMECPGYHSIFSELDVVFQPSERTQKKFEYKAALFDERFSSLTINVKGASLSGAIRAFLRPAPACQKSFSDVRPMVSSGEFSIQKALVIGGSRGLGEAAAKLLAAGGAQVRLTFVKGRADAERIVEDIARGGGLASCMPFDVLGFEEGEVPVMEDFTPTHIYYFATPFIAARKGPFSERLFREFCAYYVSGFAASLDFCLRQSADAGRVFYPSSIFVEETPASLLEYAAAKSAGETLARSLEKHRKNLRIYRPRLVKMATDQTAGIMPESLPDPCAVLVNHLRDFQIYAP